jgi:hypothetical protein
LWGEVPLAILGGGHRWDVARGDGLRHPGHGDACTRLVVDEEGKSIAFPRAVVNGCGYPLKRRHAPSDGSHGVSLGNGSRGTPQHDTEQADDAASNR